MNKDEQMDNLLSMMDCDHACDNVVSNSISYDWGSPVYDQPIEFSYFDDDDTLICPDLQFDNVHNYYEGREEEVVEIIDQNSDLLSSEQISNLLITEYQRCTH